MKNEITINDLSVSVDKLTNLVDNLAVMVSTRFDKMDTRIDKLENGMNARFDKIDERFDVIENIKLHGLETRLEHQEDKMLQAQVFLKTKFA